MKFHIVKILHAMWNYVPQFTFVEIVVLLPIMYFLMLLCFMSWNLLTLIFIVCLFGVCVMGINHPEVDVYGYPLNYQNGSMKPGVKFSGGINPRGIKCH